MNKNRALSSAVIGALVLSITGVNTSVQAATEVTRMAGADRFATAQSVAKQSFVKSENVILVNGLGYADAVSATPFAKAINAPILLTDNKDVTSLLATLTTLGTKNIYIVGGTGVVSTDVEGRLSQAYKVERIAGNVKDGRYGTNVEVAKRVLAKTGKKEAILVNGQDGYADALSVASIAATKGYPVLFGNTKEVPAVVKDTAKGLNVMAVGGQGVLPDTVLSQVAAKRISSGADRFETNLKVIEHFKLDLNFDNIFVAAGGDDNNSKFADALVASAAAAKHGAPVVLTGLGAPTVRVDNATNFIKANKKENTKVTLVGGIGSITQSIENSIRTAIGAEPGITGEAKVSDTTSIGLNQVKITFGNKVDADSAEDVTNYEVDDIQLTPYDESKGCRDTDAVAELQDDGRTIVLTIADTKSQNDKVTFKVRKSILSEDKSKTINSFNKEITFKDTESPTVKSIEPIGNSKISIDFTEAILVKDATTLQQAVEKLADKIELNDQAISGLGTNNEFTEAKNSLITTDGVLVNRIEFYFTSPMDDGTNTLKVPKGDSDILVDVAGFPVQEVTKTFTVTKLTSTPKITKITGGVNGKIYIDFDRAMDVETALDKSYYKLNDSSLPSKASIELKNKDKQIKITGVGADVKTGMNVIELDEDLKDAFGNRVGSDMRETFRAEKDTVAPKILSVSSVDSETIRVRFSEEVYYSQATNKSNYTLKDADKTDISSEIDNIIAFNNKDEDTDIYDIKMKSDNKLTGGKYTLKVENVADLSDNIMEDYETTINGEDDDEPYVVGIARNGRKIIVKFSEKMDRNTIKDKKNYSYKDKDNKIKDLPSSTTITLSSDDKTVTIEFPSSYDSEDMINGFIVKSSIKDKAGNKMNVDSNKSSSQFTDKFETAIKENSMKMRRNGKDTEVEVIFDSSIDKVYDNGSKFKFGDSYKQELTADTVTVSGEKLTFKFKDNKDDEQSNSVKVKSFGSDLVMRIEKGAAREKAGSDIDSGKATIYSNLIVPELLIKEDSNYVTNWKSNGTDKITVKFDAQLEDMGKAYDDDFEFNTVGTSGNKSGKVEVLTSKVMNGNELQFTFDANSLKDVESVLVRAKKDNIDIRTKKDRAGDYNRYKPSDKDISGRRFKMADAIYNENKQPTKPTDNIYTVTTDTTLNFLGRTGIIVELNNLNPNQATVKIDGQIVKPENGKYAVVIPRLLTQEEAEGIVEVITDSSTPSQETLEYNLTVDTSLAYLSKTGINIVLKNANPVDTLVTIDNKEIQYEDGSYTTIVNKVITEEEARKLIKVVKK